MRSVIIRIILMLSAGILRLLLPCDRVRSVIGDLEKGMANSEKNRNLFSASFWCLQQTSMIIRGRLFNYFYWRAPMFKSNFVTFFRNLIKYRIYSAVNICGLSVGMACFIVLYIHIKHELSFDRFHRNADRIYRVVVEFTRDGKPDPFANTQAPLADALMKEFPEVVNAVRISDDLPGGGRIVVSNNDNHFELNNLLLADPSFFTIFSFPLLSGNPENVLADVNSVVISESYVQKLFGSTDPIGKSLTAKQPGGYNKDFTITGVFHDVPENSQLQFDAVFSFALQSGSLGWGGWNYSTYILLNDPANAGSLEKKFPEFENKYLNQTSAWSSRYFLQQLTSIHLHSDLRNDLNTNSSILHIYFLVSIAFVILCVASINFMNLSTAHSIRRAKEIGVRKSLGASRFKLIRQFLQEAALYSMLSSILSVFLAFLFLSSFNMLIGKEYQLTADFLYSHFLLLVSFSLAVGIVAGIYPALYISSIKPAEILKSGVAKVEGGKLYLFNKTLVVLQFAISVSFIIAALVIQNQLNYIHTMNLGYDRENLIYIPFNDREFVKKTDIVKQSLETIPGVLGVTVSSYLPSDHGYNQGAWIEGMAEEDYMQISWIGGDQDFIKTFAIELIQGRDFGVEYQSDLNKAYILNETAVKTIGIEDPVGRKFRIIEEGTIVGIAKDFHFKSVYNKIEPVVLYFYPDVSSFLYIRLSGNKMQESLESIRTAWETILPDIPFRYSFLDEDFERIYKSETQLQQVFTYATVLAFVIACLGLYALVSFSTEQRKKEIGIRKVMGAPVNSIFRILVTDYFILVLIANLISLPTIYYLSNNWMENFEYHADLRFSSFLFASALSFLLALIAVSIQSIKAALINPIQTLKNE